MAEAGGTEESPWAKGEAAFTRYASLSLSLPLYVFHTRGSELVLLHSSRILRTWSKPHSKFFDPCQEAAERSIKCLHRNGGDRQLCMDYFQ